jgi:putative peptidoglycan lipid II flippase
VSIAKSSVLMATGTIVSRILGFVRAVMLAATIGVTTNVSDAFGVANQLPNNVYAIIAAGVLSAVLVPQIVKAKGHHDGGETYINRLLTLVICVFAIVTVLTTIGAPLLVGLYTQGWSGSQLALATAFAYWCLPQLFFYGLYSVLGEVLNANSRFGPFMWSPVLNNVISIAGLGAFIALFGADPTGKVNESLWQSDRISLLAGTATLGVIAQALVLFWSWRRVDLRFKPDFHWRGVGLGPALKAAAWSLGMVIVTQIGGLVQTAVASRVITERAVGGAAIASVAAASIAWLIFMLPHSVFTVSIATAYFTKMSGHAHRGELDEMKLDLTKGLRLIGAIATLATAGLIVLAYPVARIFVGEYPSTVALGNVIVALMFGLVPFSFVFMIQRAFYALEDTRTPFWFTTLQIAVHITGSLTMAVTVPSQWLVASLGGLTSFSVLIQALVAYQLLRRKTGGFGNNGLAGGLVRFSIAAMLAAAVGFGVLHLLGGVGDGAFAVRSVLTAILASAVVAIAMVLSYLASLKFLGVGEVDEFLARAKSLRNR